MIHSSKTNNPEIGWALLGTPDMSSLFGTCRTPQEVAGRYSISQMSSFNPTNAPTINPTIMTTPAIDSALIALKKPPMLQPKAREAPIPISTPPSSPLNNSLAGAIRTRNCLPSNAATSDPMIIPKHSTELVKRVGGWTFI